MSGPAEPSDGRAVKANQDPSGEYAADWPTTLTPETIAIVVSTVGLGARLGLTLGDASTDAVGVGVAAAAELDGDGVTTVLAVADSDGVSIGVAEGSVVGVVAGVALGWVVGRAMTTTES